MGVSTGSAKVEAGEQWPVLTSVAEVCSFLGLVSYYWHFIIGFVNITHLLHQLMEKVQCSRGPPLDVVCSGQDCVGECSRDTTHF